MAARRSESRSRQLVQQGSAGKIEFVEGVRRKYPGAMDGLADSRVLLEERRPKPGGRKAGAGEKAGGPPAYDDHVLHRGHSTPYNLRPRASHRPRNVIQNDSRMSRTSKQNDLWRI